MSPWQILKKALDKAKEKIGQLEKGVDNHLRLAHQVKQSHDEKVFVLRKELGDLEEALSRQSKEFEAEREHCYALLNKIEGMW